MRTLVYRHIPMYCIHITYVWCGISTCSPSVAPVLAAVSAELVPGDSAGWRMRCVNNKIHNMIPRHPSPSPPPPPGGTIGNLLKSVQRSREWECSGERRTETVQEGGGVQHQANCRAGVLNSQDYSMLCTKIPAWQLPSSRSLGELRKNKAFVDSHSELRTAPSSLALLCRVKHNQLYHDWPVLLHCHTEARRQYTW